MQIEESVKFLTLFSVFRHVLKKLKRIHGLLLANSSAWSEVSRIRLIESHLYILLINKRAILSFTIFPKYVLEMKTTSHNFN